MLFTWRRLEIELSLVLQHKPSEKIDCFLSAIIWSSQVWSMKSFKVTHQSGSKPMTHSPVSLSEEETTSPSISVSQTETGCPSISGLSNHFSFSHDSNTPTTNMQNSSVFPGDKRPNTNNTFWVFWSLVLTWAFCVNLFYIIFHLKSLRLWPYSDYSAGGWWRTVCC